MYNKPEILMTDIPVASPYYDRLRSLNMQLDFAPRNSPEHQFLSLQIQEMKERAVKRMEADKRSGFLHTSLKEIK